MEQNSTATNQNRRAGRAKRARETVARSIPEVLKTSPRARHGINKAELLVDPEAGVGTNATPLVASVQSHPRIRLSSADTLTAASRLSERPFASKRIAPTLKTIQTEPNVAVLSMASPLKPGGGFLDGANSQEEFLCHRTTLYPSLWDSFYKLPEIGAVYTPDVMVFRDTTPEAIDLQKRDRYFVDVITAGAFRFPDAKRSRSDERLDGICSCGMSYCDRDRELVVRKMKAVMRIAQSKGAKKLVLGAWGCGTYGNPVRDVAKLWRKVVAGSPRQRRPNAEQWEGIEEVVFAVPDPAMLREFRNNFSDIEATEMPATPPEEESWAGSDLDGCDRETEYSELVAKVQETEMQIEQMSNPRTKARLRDMLAALNRQLALGRAVKASKEEDGIEEDPETDDQTEDFIITDIPGSDEEDANVYAFDDSASDSMECPISPNYEFRPPPPGLDPMTSHDEDDEVTDHESFYAVQRRSPRFDAKTGWFSGSIDEFHGFLRSNGQRSRQISHTSPVLRPESSGQVMDELALNEYLGKYEGSDVAPP